MWCYTGRRVNVMGFSDTETMKKGLRVGTGIGAIDLPNGTILIMVHQAAYNPTCDHSLLSVFQMEQCVEKVNTRSKKYHGGKQEIVINKDVKIPLRLTECLMTFDVRPPTDEELSTLTPYSLTLDDVWDPSKYNDEEGEKKFTNPSLTTKMRLKQLMTSHNLVPQIL